jgi:hypothetical protein
MTSDDKIHAALARRFGPPWYAFFGEVRNCTGFAKRTIRTADAIAMSLYKSRGIDLYGFEIKVDRGDFLHEMKKPEKAEEIAQHCDFWFLVTGDAAVASPDELPRPWGLMLVEGGKVKIRKKAERLQPEGSPVARTFVASLLQRASKASPERKALEQARQEGVEEAFEQARNTAAYDFNRLKEEADDLKRRVKEFEKASGVSIANRWDVGDVGQAVRIVREMLLSPVRMVNQAQYVLMKIADVRSTLDRAESDIKEFQSCLEKQKPGDQEDDQGKQQAPSAEHGSPP